MSEQQPHTVDRAGWPPGPWDDEPDYLSWTDEETGLPCLITRNPVGYLCGYVAVEPGHPLYEKDYEDAGLSLLRHDVTYSARCQNHICHVPEPGKPDNVWWFGFACADIGDAWPGLRRRRCGLGPSPIERFRRYGMVEMVEPEVTYKTLGHVEHEVLFLALQLKKQSR